MANTEPPAPITTPAKVKIPNRGHATDWNITKLNRVSAPLATTAL